MALFFRVVQVDDDGWECRQGQAAFDVHPTMDQAINHMLAVAAKSPPSRVYLHCRGGEAAVVEEFADAGAADARDPVDQQT